eukprot:scaffold1158_cov27-Tisochrysis_lutea.AAC.2
MTGADGLPIGARADGTGGSRVAIRCDVGFRTVRTAATPTVPAHDLPRGMFGVDKALPAPRMDRPSPELGGDLAAARPLKPSSSSRSSQIRSLAFASSSATRARSAVSTSTSSLSLRV